MSQATDTEVDTIEQLMAVDDMLRLVAAVAADAIASLVQDFEPGCVVTKFVVVAEVINTDGECGVWTTTHEGAKSWDTLGLLTYAMTMDDGE